MVLETKTDLSGQRLSLLVSHLFVPSAHTKQSQGHIWCGVTVCGMILPCWREKRFHNT